MKRIPFLLFVVVCIISVSLFRFYNRNLRGAGPAINPPVSGITASIPQSAKPAENQTALPLTIPDGFTISLFAKNLGGPRVLAWDPAGTILVSIPGQGKVVALADADGDGVSEKTITVVSGLNKPHGIAFHKGKLYIAEMNQVGVFDYDTRTKQADNRKAILDLPVGGNHVTRTIDFGPDGRLYVSVGSSCNVCVEKDSRRAAILSAAEDGSDAEIFASGLRNAVFFIWNSRDLQMWATNMGRDLLGDNTPPETINIVKKGDHFGWPYCYGNHVWDRSFDNTKKAEDFCTTTAVPRIEYQAHSAPLGLAFIPTNWPEAYRNNLLVAFHGSWNRTEPVGYKVVLFTLDETGSYKKADDFINGWLTKAGALGRPVDLLFDERGVLYITDDKSGVVYRVSVRH